MDVFDLCQAHDGYLHLIGVLSTAGAQITQETPNKKQVRAAQGVREATLSLTVLRGRDIWSFRILSIHP